MKKRKQSIDDGVCEKLDGSRSEEAAADVPGGENLMRDALQHWLSMIVEIYTGGGHIDALAYATGEGRMRVKFSSCDAVEEDPGGFLRWLAEGMQPRRRVPEAEATRH